MGHKAKITWTQVPATDRTKSPRTDKVISLLLTVIRGYATDGWGSWVWSQVQRGNGQTFTAAAGTGGNRLVRATSRWEPGVRFQEWQQQTHSCALGDPRGNQRNQMSLLLFGDGLQLTRSPPTVAPPLLCLTT